MLPDHHNLFIYSNAHRMLPTSIVRLSPRTTQFILINREPAAWVFRNPFRPTKIPSLHSVGLTRGGLTMLLLSSGTSAARRPHAILPSGPVQAGLLWKCCSHEHMQEGLLPAFVSTTILPWHRLSVVLLLLLLQVLWLCCLISLAKFAGPSVQSQQITVILSPSWTVM